MNKTIYPFIENLIHSSWMWPSPNRVDEKNILGAPMTFSGGFLKWLLINAWEDDP